MTCRVFFFLAVFSTANAFGSAVPVGPPPGSPLQITDNKNTELAWFFQNPKERTIGFDRDVRRLFVEFVPDHELPALIIALATSDSPQVDPIWLEALAREKFSRLYRIAGNVSRLIAQRTASSATIPLLALPGSYEERAAAILLSYDRHVGRAAASGKSVGHLGVTGLALLLSMYATDMAANLEPWVGNETTLSELRAVRTSASSRRAALTEELEMAKHCDFRTFAGRLFSPCTDFIKSLDCRRCKENNRHFGDSPCMAIMCRKPDPRSRSARCDFGNIAYCSVCGILGEVSIVDVGKCAWADWVKCNTCCPCTCAGTAAQAGWQTCCGMATCGGLAIGGSCVGLSAWRAVVVPMYSWLVLARKLNAISASISDIHARARAIEDLVAAHGSGLEEELKAFAAWQTATEEFLTSDLEFLASLKDPILQSVLALFGLARR